MTLTCGPCNDAKGTRDVRERLAHDPVHLGKLAKQLTVPLRDAVTMNATRRSLKCALEQTGMPVSCFSGGRTEWNRTKLGIPKTRALDAALAVGSTDSLSGWQVPTLSIKATGRGSYCRAHLDRFGFQRGYRPRLRSVFGFTTGDIVSATAPAGKKTGQHVGRVVIRKTGFFNIQTPAGVVQGIADRHCMLLQRGDGYEYSYMSTAEERRAFLSALKGRVSCAERE